MKGAIFLCDALLENTKLSILDMSFNPLGTDGSKSVNLDPPKKKGGKLPATAAHSFSEVFEVNKSLVH